MISERKSFSSMPTQDVVICGGGLAGLLLARQLRQQMPELSVTVIERTKRPLPDACHKVGESSVELGCQYLESLGLGPYMLERQLVKMGLRFFPGGGDLPLHERTEIGPCAEPIVRSYQMDRGRIENDLRDMLEVDGATLIEGVKVTTIDLGADDADHVIGFEGDVTGSVRARWVVDATGRQALLRRRMQLTRGSPHVASASWFRVKGRVDCNDMVPATETEWHNRPCAAERWRSTNHFMGPGYWAWIIPLSTGLTSIGLVIQEEVHDPSCIAGLDNTLAFLQKHEPHMHRLLDGYPIEDFLCLRKYSHTVARAWSEHRWAMVGEAGAFVDPLYSPGTDFIALANKFTVELIATERRGGDVAKKATQLNHHYRAFVSGTIDLFRQAAPVYGHPKAMATKVFWDNFSYWSFTCHFSQQSLFKLSPEEYEPFAAIGRRFLELGNCMQGFLRNWALLAPGAQKQEFIGAPHFPSVLIDAHCRVGQKMTLEETLDYYQKRIVQAEELAGEIVLRTIALVGPEVGQQLLETARFPAWGIRIAPERIETELMAGHARRTRLSTIARDLERTVGLLGYHERAGAALELLGATGAANATSMS
jgi:flavin-dependent dehydrogenase